MKPFCVPVMLLAMCSCVTGAETPYPRSRVIERVEFDFATHRRLAPGSDNWPTTWADDGNLYTAWGDGGGFGGTNGKGRVTLGVARIEGDAANYAGRNVWGGFAAERAAQFDGKSYGLLGVGGALYMWVAHQPDPHLGKCQLASSHDHGATWQLADWTFEYADQLTVPTFLNFGRDYEGARDGYVYSYFIHPTWGPGKSASSRYGFDVHKPGRVYLARVPREAILDRSRYEFFTGFASDGVPRWSAQASEKKPVFEDAKGVGWNLSVSFNPGLRRYLLATEHGETHAGKLGLFDAPEPWGPWTTVACDEAWGEGHVEVSAFYWNFPAKWLSADGRSFTLIFTGKNTNDSWNTVDGRFVLAPRELPAQASLPDPLVMSDGRRVTTRDQWMNERRPELIEQFQHYMYGRLPPQPASVSGKVEREDREAFGGKATLKEVTVTFGPPEVRPIHLMLIVPNGRPGPAPVVLGLNYFGNHTLVRDPQVRLSTNWMPERGAGVVNNLSTEASRGTWTDIWRIEDVIARGYALATFYNGDIDPDRTDERGIQTHFRQPDPADDCGTVGAWAWGLQRAVDYLVTAPEIDPHRIIVTGHSRLGKAALVAAAFDERIALAIPHQAGSGGSAPSRTEVRPWQTGAPPSAYPPKPPETVTQINEKFPHWFNARFKEFNDRPERLPFDQNCLVALCAPRPVLFSNGRSDTWINPAGQLEVLRAAAPVYRLLGAGDFTATELPPDGTVIDSTLGFFIRPGGHSLKPEDWKAFLDFADHHLPAPATVEVPRWEMHEFELHGRCTVENPFRDAVVTGEFTTPSGRSLAVEGFHDGGDSWRLRFAPDEEGEWRYRLQGKGVEIQREGRLKCVAPHGHGFIRIHPENPYAFACTDGTAFFPMGDTCYGLYDDSQITPALRREYLETRRGQRFNFVRMSVGHSKARAAADPAFWAWGGTAEQPDLDRFNPVFFRGLDELFRDLQARRMNVELILLNYYRPPFTNPQLWTPARERLWLRYVLARYAAFPNVFLWTLANEYETHPDGRYRLDQPGDVAWAKATAQLVKQFDPYRHPVTVHPVISSSTHGASPRDPFDAPWRIGGFFGEGGEIDVLSQQTGQWGTGVVWDEQLQCWTGDAPELTASIRADRSFRKPVLNSENGYEYLRGHPTEKKQVHHTDKVRHSAWRIVCAGGYVAAGFNGTIGHSDAWNRIDAPNRYDFTVKDEGAAAQLGLLYDFFTALPYWRMQPFDGVTGDAAVALAEPGKVYAVYLPHGGETTVDLSAVKGPTAARWFNPRDGRMSPVPEGSSGGFKAPDAEDWVLRLEAK